MERSSSLLFKRYSSCCSTPRRSPLDAVFFTSRDTSCPSLIFANGDPAPLGGRPHHGPDVTEGGIAVHPVQDEHGGPIDAVGLCNVHGSRGIFAVRRKGPAGLRDHPIQNDQRVYALAVFIVPNLWPVTFQLPACAPSSSQSQLAVSPIHPFVQHARLRVLTEDDGVGGGGA